MTIKNEVELLSALETALFYLESPIASWQFNSTGTITRLRKLADESKARLRHTHVAGTLTGQDIDICSACGRDLREDIHASHVTGPTPAEILDILRPVKTAS